MTDQMQNDLFHIAFFIGPIFVICVGITIAKLWEEWKNGRKEAP